MLKSHSLCGNPDNSAEIPSTVLKSRLFCWNPLKFIEIPFNAEIRSTGLKSRSLCWNPVLSPGWFPPAWGWRRPGTGTGRFPAGLARPLRLVCTPSLAPPSSSPWAAGLRSRPHNWTAAGTWTHRGDHPTGSVPYMGIRGERVERYWDYCSHFIEMWLFTLGSRRNIQLGNIIHLFCHT